MGAVVVDTDVMSFVFKGDTRTELYRAHLTGQTWIASFMAVAELDRWALARNWGQPRRERLEQLLERIAICYANRDLCRLWAEASDSARRNGKPISCADAWTAAVALMLNTPLLTHNAADYQGVAGLHLIG